MKEPASKGDVLLIGILIILSFYLNSKHRNELHKEVMDTIKPVVHKIDSISDHIHFTDTSHFKWCDFVPNGKYKAYK